MKTLNFTKQAWATSAANLNSILLKESDPELYNSGMTSHGWIPLGEAAITITLPAENDLKSSAINALRAEIKKVTAEAAKKKNDLEGMINDLLMLSYEPREPDPVGDIVDIKF